MGFLKQFPIYFALSTTTKEIFVLKYFGKIFWLKKIYLNVLAIQKSYISDTR